MNRGSTARRCCAWLCALALGTVLAPGASADHGGPFAFGFENPESVLWVPFAQPDAIGTTGMWLVSNFGGYTVSPTTRDGNGFISVVGQYGTLAEPWLTGLHAPHGMRARGNRLYVADVGEVAIVRIGRSAGTLLEVVPIPGAEFLNDVAVDPATGDVFVSDSFTDTIHRLPGGKGPAEVFVQGSLLEAPNGLLVDGGELIVASFGPGTDPATFQSELPGRLLAVDLSTKAIRPISARLGNLDGLEKIGDRYLTSSFWDGRVLTVERDGGAVREVRTLPTAADLAYAPDDGRVAVPHLGLNVISFDTVR